MINSPKQQSHREDVLTVFKNETPVTWYSNLIKPSNCYSNNPPPPILRPQSVTRFCYTRRLNKPDKLLSYVIGYQCLVEQVLFKFYVKVGYPKTTPGCEPELEKRCTEEVLTDTLAGSSTIPSTADIFEIVLTCATGSGNMESTSPADWLIHPVVSIRLTPAGIKHIELAHNKSMSHLVRTLDTWTRRLQEPPACTAGTGDRGANPREIEKFYMQEPLRARDGSATIPVAVCAMINDQSSQVVKYLWDVPLYVLYYSLTQALGQNIPRSFLPCYENEEWRVRLASKRMSIYVRIVNNTKYKLELLSPLDPIDCSIIAWPSSSISPMGFTEFGVGNGKFHIRSLGFALVYRVIGRNTCFLDDRIQFTAKLTSSQPSPRIKASGTNLNCPDSLCQLRVEVSYEAINCATVIFRVFDSSSPPYVTILECTPSSLHPSKCSRLPCCGRTDFSQLLRQWRESVLVSLYTTSSSTVDSMLPRSLSFSRQSPRRSQTSAERDKTLPRAPNLAGLISRRLATDHLVKQPSDFYETRVPEESSANENQDSEPNVIAQANGLWFTDIQTSMCSAKRFTLPPIRQILIDLKLIGGIASSLTSSSSPAGDSGLEYRSALLRYKIGCEVFSRVLDIQDWATVTFNTAYPGALTEEWNAASTPGELLATELVSLDNVIPPEYTTELTAWLTKLLKGELGGPSFTEQYKRHFAKSVTETNVRTAHALLYLLTKVIDSFVQTKQTAKLPRAAASLTRAGSSLTRAASSLTRAASSTRNEEHLVIADVQTALDFVLMNWDTQFAEHFPESPTFFDPVRRLSSYWLTQDFASITPAVLEEALRVAVTITSRLGNSDIVETLKKTVDDPIDRGLSWLALTVNH